MTIVTNILENQNPVTLLLFGLSVICVAAVLDRLLFWISSAIRFSRIPSDIRNWSQQGTKQLTRKLSARKRTHYTEALLLAWLKNPNCDYVSQVASERLELMSARLGTLDLTSKLAPLLGILGTVVGMAVSFGGIGSLATAPPSIISSGISLALHTTAYGLVISIAASIAAATFRKCVRRATVKMGSVICELQNDRQNKLAAE